MEEVLVNSGEMDEFLAVCNRQESNKKKKTWIPKNPECKL